MNSLRTKAYGSTGLRLVFIGSCLFAPAGTFDYWQAWVYVGLLLLTQVSVAAYLLKNDPGLLARRLKGGPWAEMRRGQKVIMGAFMVLAILTMVVPGLDRRFHWSLVPTALAIGAHLMVMAGLVIAVRVMLENSFASATIGVFPEQKVISTGPYGWVRHPMYSGALLIHSFLPLALGSWWGLPFGVGVWFVIIWRLRDEEQMLRERLPGYAQYCDKVRYRLVPGVW